jgi:hypothetical protein
MVDVQYQEMLKMEELELMNYFKSDIIKDVFGKHDLRWLLKDSPKVKLNALALI